MNKTEEKPNTAQEETPARKKLPRWGKILLGVAAVVIVGHCM